MSYANTAEIFVQKYTQNINMCDEPILSSKKGENHNKKITPVSISHSQWFNRVNIWMQRSRQRRDLAQLDPHLLDDLGLTKEMVAKEMAKPFWR